MPTTGSIILIDSDSDSRLMLSQRFSQGGFDTEAFSDGPSALDYLRQSSDESLIRIVVADLNLSGLSGLDILRFVNNFARPAPVILMSDAGNVSDVVEALRLGAADYLIKPIADVEVAMHAVERALNIVTLQQENESYRARLEAINREMTDHIQLLERDQQAAKHVQRNLLPITPVTYRNVELSHLVHPSLYLSGDFVDYGCLHRRYIAFYLTDVSGHGASSAFVTVWMKQLVRRIFRERQLFQDPEQFHNAPAELVDVINGELMQSRFFSHMTSVVGLIDTETHDMRYVIAGHLPLPILIKPSGEACFLEGKGKPLGLFESARWQVNALQLSQGYRLLVFSDGILEALPGDGMLKKEQYLLAALQGLPAQATVAEIGKMLHLDFDQEMPDDIAILSVQEMSLL